jgi:hypothetical protein
VPSTAWQRMATGGGSHLSPDRSHLSPDGGGSLLCRPPLGSGWLRVAVATCRQTVATCRQTVEVFSSAVHRLAANGYGRR